MFVPIKHEKIVRTKQPFTEPRITDIRAEGGTGAHLVNWDKRVQDLKNKLTDDFESPEPWKFSGKVLRNALSFAFEQRSVHCFFKAGRANHDTHDDHHCPFCRRWVLQAVENVACGDNRPMLKTKAYNYIKNEWKYWIDKDDPETSMYREDGDCFAWHYWMDKAIDDKHRTVPIPDYMKTDNDEEQLNLQQCLSSINRNEDPRFEYDNHDVAAAARQQFSVVSRIGWSTVWPHGPQAPDTRPKSKWEKAAQREIGYLTDKVMDFKTIAWTYNDTVAELRDEVCQLRGMVRHLRQNVAELDAELQLIKDGDYLLKEDSVPGIVLPEWTAADDDVDISNISERLEAL